LRFEKNDNKKFISTFCQKTKTINCVVKYCDRKS